MQKIVGVIIAIVVVVVGVWFIFINLSPSDTQDSISNQTSSMDSVSGETEPVAPPSGYGSFLQLFGFGQNLECTFTFSDDTISGEGTAFLADGKMRIDSMYEGDDGEIYTSNVITDEENMYVWAQTENGTFAMVFPVPEEGIESMESAEGLEDNASGVSVDDQVQYDCKLWPNVDGSVFVPPSNLEFTNMNDMMLEMMRGFEGY